MSSVQSAAFTLLMPAGAAYEPGDLGGSASMLAEWITRGAGDLDSRELLTALDNLGVSHGEGAQTLHTSVSAATLGRQPHPRPRDLCRRPPQAPPGRRGGRADPRLGPPKSSGAGRRPRLEGDLRIEATTLPRPLGSPLPRHTRRGPESHARRPPGLPRVSLSAQRRDSGRRRRDRLRDVESGRRPALRRLGAQT